VFPICIAEVCLSFTLVHLRRPMQMKRQPKLLLALLIVVPCQAPGCWERPSEWVQMISNVVTIIFNAYSCNP
jgi:hypothetical protein